MKLKPQSDKNKKMLEEEFMKWFDTHPDGWWADFCSEKLQEERKRRYLWIKAIIRNNTDDMFGTIDYKKVGEEIVNFIAETEPLKKEKP